MVLKKIIQTKNKDSFGLKGFIFRKHQKKPCEFNIHKAFFDNPLF